MLDPKTNTPVVTLREVDGERKLPIWIGPGEASAIATRLDDLQLDRPHTHDLAAAFVVTLGGRITEVRIHSVEGRTYRAEVVLERDGEFIAVDSRPSDSIAIALRAQAEIFVADHLFWPPEGATPAPAERE